VRMCMCVCVLYMYNIDTSVLNKDKVF